MRDQFSRNSRYRASPSRSSGTTHPWWARSSLSSICCPHSYTMDQRSLAGSLQTYTVLATMGKAQRAMFRFDLLDAWGCYGWSCFLACCRDLNWDVVGSSNSVLYIPVYVCHKSILVWSKTASCDVCFRVYILVRCAFVLRD